MTIVIAIVFRFSSLHVWFRAESKLSHYLLCMLSFQVVLQAPVCVEEFSKNRALGRVFLRALGRTVAVGIVTRIIEEVQ